METYESSQISLSPLKFYIQSSLNHVNCTSFLSLLYFTTATALVKHGLLTDGFHKGKHTIKTTTDYGYFLNE